MFTMWQFVHFSDPHLSSKRDGVWNNRFLCTMMPGVMKCLRRDLAEIQPDFLLVTGDICSRQTRAAMLSARDELEKLGFPYYPMGGNHDFVLPDSRAWFLEAFEHRLPDTNTFYTFTHRNLRFCVLDAWWRWPDGTLRPTAPKAAVGTMDDDLKGLYWALPPEQLVWLEDVLKARQDLPVIVALHYPALPIPQRLRHPGLRDGGHLDNGNLLMDLLERFPRVKAVLSGHVHVNFIERGGPVVQICTGALPEYPTEFRVFSVHDDRIEIATRGLSDPSFAARSLIEGHGYTSGCPEDRESVIPL